MSVTMIKDLARAVLEQQRQRRALPGDAPEPGADAAGAAPEAAGPASPPDTPKDSSGTDT